MSASLDPLVDGPLVDSLQLRLHKYQSWKHSLTNSTSCELSPSPPSSPPPLDCNSLIDELVQSTQQAIAVHASLSLLASQHATQSRQVDRLLAENQRLQRENDSCVDQLFLHSIPIEGVAGTVKLAMDSRGTEKKRRRPMATGRTTLFSGFDSTDEDGGSEDDDVDSDDETASQTSASGSETPTHERPAHISQPNNAAVSTPAPTPSLDWLVQSVASHPSIQQINSHLSHLSTLLTLQASQALPTLATPSPSSTLSSAVDFNRTASSGSGAVFGRSTEMEAVRQAPVQLQRERHRRSRRIVGQLRQLLVHQSAELVATRSELDMLRLATQDAHTSSTARDTRQLHEWMEASAERPATRHASRTAAIVADGRVGGAGAARDATEACDVQQLCGMLDGVMRHVQDSAVCSQSYVENVKRLYAQQSHAEPAAAMAPFP